MRGISTAIKFVFILTIVGFFSFSYFSVKGATLQNNMDAEFVIGAGSASQNFAVGSGGLTSSTFNDPTDIEYDSVGNRLFVADENNARVLVFNTNSDGTLSDYVADYVLGQSDFVSNTETTTQSGMHSPEGLAFDADRQLLFVSDYLESEPTNESGRILVYDVRDTGSEDFTLCGETTTGIATGMDASCVLGQSDFVTAAAAESTQRGLRHARGITLDDVNDRLYVSDLWRVLMFDVRNTGSGNTDNCGYTSTGLANGMNASCVLGQQDFTSEVSTTTQSGIKGDSTEEIFYEPNNGYLFLSDALNARMLVWDVSGVISNGMAASYVLGQSDFISNATSTPSASTFAVLGLPKGMVSGYDSSDGRLFVSDQSGSRVLIFDISSGIENGMAASYVLGQSDFTSNAFDTNRKGFLGAGSGYYFESAKRLYIPDPVNNRILVFNFTPSSSGGPNPTYYVDPPQCIFNAPEYVIDGEALELSWSHTWPGQFTSPYYYKLNGVLYPAGSSGVTIYPEDNLYPDPTQDFELAAINTYGATICNETVQMVEELTCSADADPEEVYLGGEVEFSWEVSGGLPPYESPDGESFESPITITPEENGNYTYQVAVEDHSNQQAFCEADFEVVEPEAEPEPFVCHLVANDDELLQGESTALSWVISGGQSPYLTYLRQDPVEDSFIISQPYDISPLQHTLYEIAVVDDAGEIANCAEGVAVWPQETEPEEEVVENPVITPPATPEPPVVTPPSVPILPPDSPIVSPDPVIPDDPVAPIVPSEPQLPAPEGVTFRTVDIANFVSQPETQVGVVAALVIGIITAIAGAFATPLAGAELFLLPARLWNILLTALGLRKQQRPWGTVYDSHTKQPLDPVHVVLMNMTTGEQKTAITDMDGRYSFVVDQPGTYTLSANKKDYAFPSAKLSGQGSDHLYQNLYFGSPFQVSEKGQVITKNIPLDSTAVNWNEQDKLNNNRLKFYKKRDYILTKAANTLFYLGFALAVLATIFFPAPFNIATVALYVVFALIKKTGYGGRPTGSVMDSNDNPIPHAILRLISPALGQEIKHTVADKYGRYHLLANNGTYNLTVEERINEEVTRGINITAEVKKGYYGDNVMI